MGKKLDTVIRQDQIAEAALQTIQAYGLKGLNMERIALLVGLRPSALYRHFAGKGKVLDAVLELLHTRLITMVDEAQKNGHSPLEQMKEILRKHILFVQHFQALPRILFSDDVYIGEPARKAKVYEIISDYLDHIAQIARAGQQTGSIRTDIEARNIAVMILGMFQPAVMLWFLSDGGFDTSKHVERVWLIFSEGIRPLKQNKVDANTNSHKRRL